MNVFRRLGNALSRFMYGRNGADQLGLCMLWLVILVNVIGFFIPRGVGAAILSAVSLVLGIVVIYRLFSRDLHKRRAENARFLEKVWYPVQRRFNLTRTQSRDKAHKYFTCPNCGAICRVPRGKGNIVITCPRCRGEIRGKS